MSDEAPLGSPRTLGPGDSTLFPEAPSNPLALPLQLYPSLVLDLILQLVLQIG